MEMKLNRISLENFKNITTYNLVLGGKSATIMGRNGAGKTTIYDALLWLLFGKDSSGKKDFDIKPMDKEGRVKCHGAVSSVTSEFLIDGTTLELRKTYYEKWTSPRGSAEKEFSGHASDYFVDGVACIKREYEEKIKQYITEDAFKELTNLYYFPSVMKWQDRRNRLFDICRIASDEEIIAKEERFLPLLTWKGSHSLEDYKKILLAKRKGLNSDRENIPVRLDECQKTVLTLEGIDFKELELGREVLAKEQDAISGEILKLKNSSALIEKKTLYQSLCNEESALLKSNTEYRNSQKPPVDTQKIALQTKLQQLELQMGGVEKSIFACNGALQREEKYIALLEEKVQGYRNKWMTENTMIFTEDMSCPTCNRRYDEQSVLEAKRAFEKNRDGRLDIIVQESKGCKKELEERRHSLSDRQGELESLTQSKGELLSKIDWCKSTIATYIEEPFMVADLERYASKMEEYTRKKDGLILEMGSIHSSHEGVLNAHKQNLFDVTCKLKALNDELAKEAMLTATKERMDILRQEAKEKAEQTGQVDKALYLLDEFVKFKCNFIEQGINSKFLITKFKLFDVQVTNDAVVDCCEPIYNGIGFNNTLNTGAKMMVGMDIISTLSSHYGRKTPIFIDNSESVTEEFAMDTQVIKLKAADTMEQGKIEVKLWD